MGLWCDAHTDIAAVRNHPALRCRASFSTTSTWYNFRQVAVLLPVSEQPKLRFKWCWDETKAPWSVSDHPLSGSRHCIVNSSDSQLKLIDIRSIIPSEYICLTLYLLGLLCNTASLLLFHMCMKLHFDNWWLNWHNRPHFSLKVYTAADDVLWNARKCFLFFLIPDLESCIFHWVIF